MAEARPRVYLAGPEVFHPEARALGARKAAICASAGLEGVFPLDGTPTGEPDPTHEGGLAIAAHCLATMDACDALIANMTPFRGPSADAGTAVEMGYMRGRGRPVFAYSNTALPYIQRVAVALGGELPRREDGTPVDPEDMAVEPFGLADNLMLDGVVTDSGGAARVVVRETQFLARWTDMTAFEAAVRRAAQHLLGALNTNGG
ncbi:nucleoside 2-deoxyribosyltransferase [Roseospira navarrensis]|uniref:Nucleoside 2-deoxyribosyltransferase n=1 Tax=Roseospira navarrensis TaxID=140058 RepID=A0A7X2D214_9PROT|nr:nucleoside 2-deoxyribosyltransferase [Roseospira navarrensis]MQX35799.1 nucleoside 2-deoxyribosyltransferase [Roseospira navarrensis]